MLSNVSRRLTYLTAALYGVLGAILFIAPAHTSSAFAWKVTPFITMTIGAWCLGNAWLAWNTARRWQWWLVRTTLIYLWLFGILQAAVVIAFRDKLQLDTPIALFYVATLAVNTLTAACGIADWVRIRPSARSPGEHIGPFLRFLVLGFVLFVLFIAGYGLLITMGGRGTNGTIFPELMTPFTLRSFAVFYMSLALSAMPLLWARDRATLLHHGYASYGLVSLITIATFVYNGLFNFAERPWGLLYIGAYVSVGAAVGVILLKHGTGFRQSHAASVSQAERASS